jgi:hypothetical protein
VRTDADAVLIRDSRDPDGPKLEFDKQSFRDFVSCVRGDGHWI